MTRTVADAAALLGVLAGETYGEGSERERCVASGWPSRRNPETSTSRTARCSSRPWSSSASAARSSSRCASCRRARSSRRCCTSSPATSTPTRDAAGGAPIRTMRRARRVERGARRPGPQVRAGACSRRRWPSTTTPSARPTSDSVPRPRGGGRARHRCHPRRRERRGDRLPGQAGCGFAARAGYPSMAVPAGYRRENRRPLGFSFVGPARSEGLLLGPGRGVRGGRPGAQAALADQPVAALGETGADDLAIEGEVDCLGVCHVDHSWCDLCCRCQA